MNKIKCLIVILICIISLNIKAQNLDLEIQKITEYKEAFSQLQYDLDVMSKNFIYFNETDLDSANLLLTEILELNYSVGFLRDLFLYKVYYQLDSLQRNLVANHISSELRDTNNLYCILVSIYNLKTHFSKILSKIDSSYSKNILTEFITDGKISDTNIKQLKYVSTLANLKSDSNYETDLIELVEKLYKSANGVTDDNKRNNMLIVLYKRILPNSIGRLYTKSSVVNTLYFMDDSSRIHFGNDVMDSHLAWEFLKEVVLRKLSKIDERHWDIDKFYLSIEGIKDELINDNSIWRHNIKIK